MNIIMSRAVPHSLFLPVQPQKQIPARITSPCNLNSPTSPLDFTDKIPFSELKLSNETLGSGSFGTVFKGRWRSRNVAVKQFKTREEIDSFLVEVKQLSCVKHPNIVTLYGASALADTAYLIMEYAEGGSLNHLLHDCKQQEYDLRHACSWAMQTARGVAYLHSIRPKPIMHRDLKPANLLLFSRGKILKICDFGTACAVKTQMTNNTGSASYMAPEVFATSSYLESGDVFSWSIIFWEILVRSQPYSQEYSNLYQILWSVNQGTRPTEIENCPEPIWNLISKSWDKSPLKRPSMQQVAREMDFIFSLTVKRNIDGGASAQQGSSRYKESTNRNTHSGQPNAAEKSPTPSMHDSQQSTRHSRQSLPSIGSTFDRLCNTRMTTSDRLSEFRQQQSTSVASTSSSISSSHQYQHHLYQKHPFSEQELYRQQIFRQQQSNHSHVLAENRRKALKHHVEELQKRFKHLESSLTKDELKCKKNLAAVLEEFEGLKGRIKTLRQHINENSQHSSSSGPSNSP